MEAYINEISTWYLRRSRKREDLQFFQTIYEVLKNLSSMLAPFTPFMAESLFQSLRQDGDEESVHLVDWPGVIGQENTDLEKNMATVRQAVELGLSVRAAEKLRFVSHYLGRFCKLTSKYRQNY